MNKIIFEIKVLLRLWRLWSLPLLAFGGITVGFWSAGSWLALGLALLGAFCTGLFCVFVGMAATD